MLLKVSLVACLFVFPTTVLSEPELDYTGWNLFLNRFVSEGLVDYQEISKETELIDDFLNVVESVNVGELPDDSAKIAFWINTYNAFVVMGVVDNLPLKSVEDVAGFFDGIKYKAALNELTLNEMEDAARSFGEPRVHFALVCASRSCPMLRNEAYIPERLESQLAEETARFLENPNIGLNIDGSVLYVSKIFDWYKSDFFPSEKFSIFNPMKPQDIFTAFEPYIDRERFSDFNQHAKSLRFMDYDWDLNDRKGEDDAL